MLTKHERGLVEQAASCVAMVTQKYCQTVEKQIEAFSGSKEQMTEIHDSIRTLNHAACAIERLCRALSATEPGKDFNS